MRTILSAFVAAYLALAGSDVGAQAAPAEREINLKIDSETLAGALDQWAAQTGVHLVSPSWKIAKKLAATPLKGPYTAREALEKLLSGTPLAGEWVSDKAVAIREKPSIPPSALQSSGTDPKQADVPIARLGGETWGERGLAANDQGAAGRAGPATRNRGKRDEGNQDDIQELEEIVVTGTHIRGAAPTGASVITITRSEIDRTGYSRAEDLLETIPQNFSEISPGGRLATEGGSTLTRLNDDQASSINLRGLGAQSTLTLIDSRRIAGSVGGRVVDISMLPLSMIERVEVVTGGHSAIYGADAVGGVANLVTRRDFEGAQTQLSYGSASEGGERMQASQLAGMRFENGGFAVGYDYSQDWPFDLADVGLLSKQPNPVVGDTTLQRYIQSDSRRHSGFVSGHYSSNDTLRFFGNALYTHKRFEDEERELLPGATTPSVNRVEHPADLYAVTGGAEIGLSAAWRLALTGATSGTDLKYDSATVPEGSSTPTSTFLRRDKATVSSLSAVADGELFPVGAHRLQAALGIEQRREEFRRNEIATGAPIPPANADTDRTVRSAFVEFILPVVRNGQFAMLERLELSAAARYDDYSDFGDTVNPQFGAVWEPITGFAIRGGYAKAFRAPALSELVGTSAATLRRVADPQSPTGTTPLVTWLGNNEDLGPEKADSWNVGLEFQPLLLPNTSIALNYFDVNYEARIEVPATAGVDQRAALTREALYPGLIARSPQVQDLQALFGGVGSFFNLSGTPFGVCPPAGLCAPDAQSLLTALPTVAIFDNRTNNISVDKVRGLDLLLSSKFATSIGEFSYGLNATYTLDHTRSITATSPVFDVINEIGKPVDFRVRASVGWTRSAFGAYGYVNYVDGYANPFSTPVSEMPSWTTIDLTLQLNGSASAGNGVWRGLVGTLSIENVLDKDPPRYRNSIVGVLYDAANATPWGRYVSLRLAKQW